MIINQDLEPGSSKIDLDATKYSSGMYFYRVQFKTKNDVNQSFARKMVLLK